MPNTSRCPLGVGSPRFAKVLCPVVFSGVAGGRMVGGIKRQPVGDRANKSRNVRRLFSEMEQMTRDEIYLQRHRRFFGSRPIRVLTCGKPRRRRLDSSAQRRTRSGGTRQRSSALAARDGSGHTGLPSSVRQFFSAAHFLWARLRANSCARAASRALLSCSSRTSQVPSIKHPLA